MGIHHALSAIRGIEGKRHAVANARPLQNRASDIRARLIERCGAPIQTFMGAHTFSTIALHKSRLKSISRSPRGRVIRGNVHGKRRNPARVKLHIHVQIYTISAGITPTSAGDIKRLFALMNVWWPWATAR